MKPASSYPRQVDATTCGIASLAVVAARAGKDSDYLRGDRQRIARTQVALHEVAARVGLPWPKSLGTSPWALARLARRATGLRYKVVTGEKMGPAIDESLRNGLDVFGYTGGSDKPFDDLIPRHVIAILAGDDGDAAGVYSVFEPSSGQVFKVRARAVLESQEEARPALGYWHRILFALTPVQER
ncbi:hypothetical protein [Schaalia vaccimaxillae]|uniref:hypothetical protein n=1 Tax=Schaalia vaccimaxillae TaxID=183916 RepID=UPI0003B71A1D|nr:hypothetical protein [Schaalia vaccimaxillae]